MWYFPRLGAGSAALALSCPSSSGAAWNVNGLNECDISGFVDGPGVLNGWREPEIDAACGGGGGGGGACGCFFVFFFLRCVSCELFADG